MHLVFHREVCAAAGGLPNGPLRDSLHPPSSLACFTVWPVLATFSFVISKPYTSFRLNPPILSFSKLPQPFQMGPITLLSQVLVTCALQLTITFTEFFVDQSAIPQLLKNGIIQSNSTLPTPQNAQDRTYPVWRACSALIECTAPRLISSSALSGVLIVKQQGSTPALSQTCKRTAAEPQLCISLKIRCLTWH